MMTRPIFDHSIKTFNLIHDWRYSRVVIQLAVFAAALIVTGCGATGQGRPSQNRLADFQYDENLTFRLEGIISGETGTTDLRAPISLDKTATGGLVVLEQTPPRIMVLDSTWNVVNQISSSGRSYAKLTSPRFVRSGFGLTYNIVDETGDILVYDSQLRFLNSFEPVDEA
ncbi:MAG: hypothetical protein GY869_15875, partial [Planctomycetes bacterium]|nr:hypothetical protein [Planctomycetota bacterium]